MRIAKDNRRTSQELQQRSLATALSLLLLGASAAVAAPSSTLSTYALFAQNSLRVRTMTLNDGDVGVNDGLLYLRGAVLGSESDFVGDVVHLDSTTACDRLYANAVVGDLPASCPQDDAMVPHPVITNLGGACGFPPPADFACSNNPADDVIVGHGMTLEASELVSGKRYRDLVVQGGGEGPAVLKLDGTYHFCNVRVGRNGSIRFQGPSTVTIMGSSRVSNAVDVGPDDALGAAAPHPGAIKWFVQGTQARFSRNGRIALHACAPSSKMLIGSGTSLTGRFVARSIRVKKSTVTFAPPVPGICGDTVLSPGEGCEAGTNCGDGKTCVGCACVAPTTTTTSLPGCDDDADCNPGSPGGVFVCEDGHCVTTTTTTLGGTTSTTGGSTTTTPASTTSTTTLAPCATTRDCPIGVCQDGVCVPECKTDGDCPQGSPAGAFVCVDGRCASGHEVCDDCTDNDGDGFVDFEDPDCCDVAAGRLFAMDLRKGRVRPRSAGQSLLRLKGGLARNRLGGMIAPPADHVMVQVHGDASELLCARIPAGKFVKRKKTYRFSQKRTPLPVEVGRNLDRVVIKVLKNGKVRFRVKGKRAQLATPAEGILTITVGFTRPGTAASENVCSQAVRLFRGGKKGQLRFP